MRKSTLPATAGLLLAFLTLPVSAEDQSITVPNGDFETAANDDTLGGVFPGLFSSGTLSATPLGGGPWNAQSTGLLNLLIAPQVTIASNGSTNGTCRISGLAIINVLGGLLNNRASAYQTLTVQPEPQAIYTLEADVDRGTLLSAAILSQNGVGIALTVNGATVATSFNGTAPLLSVELLSGTSYRVKVYYQTGDTPPTGPIGIRLFAGEGAALLAVGVLPAVTFDNVKLTITRLES